MFDRKSFSDIYPFSSHWLVTKSGAKMHYVDEGSDGQNVVLCLHGNPTWSFYYRKLITEISSAARVVAPDHIGCGLSDKPNDSQYTYTLQSRVQDIEHLVDFLSLKNITLVLHDWGGMIGMTFAHRHPDIVKNIVLLNTGAFPLPKTKPLPWQLKLVRSPFGPLLVQGLNAFARGTANLGTIHPLSPRIRQGLLAPYDSWSNRIATLRFVQDIPLTPTDRAWNIVKDTSDHLEQWKHTPVLIFWGKLDPVFDDHFLTEWKRVLPNAIVKEYQDAGHYVLEEKADDIIGGVRSLLTE